METPQDPIRQQSDSWNLRTWLAFMLLTAADADGHRDRAESRILHVNLGREAVDAMSETMSKMAPQAREDLIREQLPKQLPDRHAREKFQKLLQKVFLADGEYGEKEQAMNKRIGDWLRSVS